MEETILKLDPMDDEPMTPVGVTISPTAHENIKETVFFDGEWLTPDAKESKIDARKLRPD